MEFEDTWIAFHLIEVHRSISRTETKRDFEFEIFKEKHTFIHRGLNIVVYLGKTIRPGSKARMIRMIKTYEKIGMIYTNALYLYRTVPFN